MTTENLTVVTNTPEPEETKSLDKGRILRTVALVAAAVGGFVLCRVLTGSSDEEGDFEDEEDTED